MPDPIHSTNLIGTLQEFVRLVFDKFHDVPIVNDEMKPLLIAPRTSIVLPSYFFYMPNYFIYSAAPYYNFFNNLRQTQQANYPLLAVSGRGTRQLITLGGGVSLNINYRMYLVVAAPPSQNLVERVAFTMSHLSRVVLSIFHHPPFWWFTEVNEEDVLTRIEGGDFTIGYIGGAIRGCPHIIPAVTTD